MTEHPGSTSPLEVDGRRPADIWTWTRAIRDQSPGTLSPSARLAALVLATYADPDGTRMRPSARKLAAGMGLRARSHATTALAELVARGWLDRDASPGRVTTYRPLIPAPEPDRPTGQVDLPPPTEPDRSTGHVDEAPPPAGDQPTGQEVTGPPVRGDRPTGHDLPITSSAPQEEDARASDADDDPWAEDPPEVAAWWLVARAADLLGCEPASWPAAGHATVATLVGRVADLIHDGHDPDKIHGHLTCWPVPAVVKSWPGILTARLDKAYPRERKPTDVEDAPTRSSQ